MNQQDRFENYLKFETHLRSKELRKIINSWNLIAWASKDEFDDLNNTLISHLYRNSDLEKISRVIESKLVVTYGLNCSPEDAQSLAKEVINWWDEKEKYG